MAQQSLNIATHDTRLRSVKDFPTKSFISIIEHVINKIDNEFNREIQGNEERIKGGEDR